MKLASTIFFSILNRNYFSVIFFYSIFIKEEAGRVDSGVIMISKILLLPKTSFLSIL